MVEKKPASPHIKIEVKNATLAWDSSHSSIQNSPKLTPKTKKDKRAARGKKEKGRQLQRAEQQAVLAEQKGHLLLDSEQPSPEEDEGKHIHLGSLRLQRTLYSIDLEIEEVSWCLLSPPAPHPSTGICRPPFPQEQTATFLVPGYPWAGPGLVGVRLRSRCGQLQLHKGVVRHLTVELPTNSSHEMLIL